MKLYKLTEMYSDLFNQFDAINEWEPDTNADGMPIDDDGNIIANVDAYRNNLKQDYTPDCLCKLISELVPQTDKVIDICSGTGALTVGMGRDIQYQCEEVSAMSIPVFFFLKPKISVQDTCSICLILKCRLFCGNIKTA